MSTLLEQAVASRTHGQNFSDEDIELVIAWADGDVSLGQVETAKGMKRHNAQVYCYLARCLREAFRRGVIICANPPRS